MHDQIIPGRLTVNGRQVVTAREAARRSGYSVSYIGVHCRAGALAYALIGGIYFIDAESLRKFVERQERRREERRKRLREAARAVHTSSNTASPAQSSGDAST